MQLTHKREMVRTSWMNISYKKKKSGYAEFMSNILSYSESTSWQQDNVLRCLGWVWMKGVYFEMSFILFVSASDPVFLPPVSNRNLNELARPFYFIPGVAVLSCSHGTHKLWL